MQFSEIGESRRAAMGSYDLPKPGFSGNEMRRMKHVRLILFFLVLTFSGRATLAAAPVDALATVHYVGSTALDGNPNAAKLKKIWALPETIALRADVLQKLSQSAGKAFGTSSGADRATAIRPLLEDLLAAESHAEFHGKPGASLELYLAVRLNAARSKVWETSLLQIGKASQPPAAKLGDATGWTTRLNGSSNVLKFFRSGPWTLVFLAGDQGGTQVEFLNRIKAGKPGADQSWLEADIDWPRLQPWISLESFPLKLARTDLRIGGRGGEELRTTMRVVYPEKIDWQGEPWKIPTHTIRDPLISFSAGQKLAPFFKPSKAIQQLALNPLTTQIFFWAQAQMPFQSYFAIPIKDATNTMKNLGAQLVQNYNPVLSRRTDGKLEVSTNKIDLFWKDLPIIVPFLTPAVEKSGKELLLGGLFPLVPGTNYPPAELFKQVSDRKDLVLYDWEITEIRLSQWQVMSQLLPFFPRELRANAGTEKRFAPALVPEQKWLAAVGPLLGNTVTEVTFKAPNELNLVRKSHLGLNSLELIVLSHWLAHPGFPAANPFNVVPAEGNAKRNAAPAKP